MKRFKYRLKCIGLIASGLLCLSVVMAQPAKQGAGNTADTAIIRKKGDSNLKATGVIKDAATGKPLAAINVTIPDFSAGLTDVNGKFTINVPDYDVTLLVSGEGFQSKEIALKGRKSITTSMFEESFVSLYDNATLPQGNKPQNQVTNAVSSVNLDNPWLRQGETPDAYLQGKVAGLDATMRSGTPFTGANLLLRGYNSLYATNQPLVVVDGMIYDNTDYGTSLINNHYTNPLAEIDLKDIENITVLKDGGSLYGTKGANGVIIITTSHAKLLATKIDFSTSLGANFMPKELPVMKSADFRTYLSDVLKTRGWSDSYIQSQPYMTDDPTNPNYYRYHNETDWQKQVMDNSMNNNFYLKISGGDDIAKYALSMGYLTDGSITNNTNAKRLNTRFNADLTLSKKLTASTNLSYTYYEQNSRDQGLLSGTNPLYVALIKSPFTNPNAIADNGTKSPNLADTDTFGVSNPTAAVASNVLGKSQVYRFFGIVNLKYQFSRSLSMTVLGGTTFDKVREQTFIPRLGIKNDTLQNAVSDSRLGSQVKKLFNLYADAFLDYNKTFNRVHNVKARLGMRYQNSQTEQDIAQSYNSATDDFISVGNGVSTLRKVGGDIGSSVWTSIYLSADYGYNNKYFLTFNGAVDGSSRFGPSTSTGLHMGGNSYAVMPSVAASWIISSERFMASAKFIDLLKLSASYSMTGNDDIGNYTYRQSYVSQNYGGTASSYQIPQLTEGLVRGNVANPHLQWETNSKANLGLDMAMFNERLSISVDVYHNKTTNMLTYEPLPAASGYPFAVTNSGAMHSNGIEFTLNSRIVNNHNFKWDVGATITAYKTHVDQLPAGPIFTTYRGATIVTTLRSAPNLYYGYKTLGVFASDADAAAAKLTKKNTDGSYSAFKGGDVHFVDTNGDGVIDDNDRQVIGNPNPTFTGSFSTRFTYKAWSLEGLFTFSQGNSNFNAVRASLEGESNIYNQLLSVNNRWRANGQITNMPKATWGDPMGNDRFSDRWIEDGSFLRLKAVTVSYNFVLKPTSFIKNMTVYATGNNLLTFTHYLGYDPEFYSGQTVFSRGVDILLEPQFKSVTAGLRFGL